ncbi:MAG TPA: FAD-dependent oxidoreductase [Candidatus Binataceae bacterium]|nr:FAD-dependent oxidoreductase [Candidatus Binataceae bacterium]
MSEPSNSGKSAPAQRATCIATIERIFNHNAETRSLFLRLTGAIDFNFVPGQFISLELPLANESIVRPYSIASSPEDGQPLEICLNLVPGGVGSHYLFGLHVGDSVSFTGPFGRFTLDRSPELETIFIADTTAIAPIRPMIRRALADREHPPVRLHHAAQIADGLLYRSEFEVAAANDPRFSFEPALLGSNAESSAAGAFLLDQVNRRYVAGDDDRKRQFYVCGVGKMVFELRDLLRSAGYERRAVQYERW